MSSIMEAKTQHTFKWKIEDFHLCDKGKSEYIKSPVFRANSMYDTCWYVSLYPRGHEESSDGYMGCYLNRCKNDGSSKIECDFEISILNLRGKTLQSNKTSYVFAKGDFFGWPDFWKKTLQDDDTNDVLLVHCILKSNAWKIPLRSENSGLTNFESDQRSTKFIARNINSNCSEEYGCHYKYGSKFQISLKVVDDDVKIAIRRGEGDSKAKSVICQISLLDVEGIQSLSMQDFHFFEKGDPSNDIWEFPTFLKKSKLNSEKEKYLENDCFTLKYKLTISNGFQTVSIEDKEQDSFAVDFLDKGSRAVLEDYKRLYKEKIHADVKLRVEGQIIEAHKSILSLRSSVFMAMFDTDMTENEKGCVDIPDLEAETVSSLLEYMYTGNVEKLDYAIAMKLVVAADKYQVLSLIERCASFLESVLSVENVCDVLSVADLLQLEGLKDVSLSYVKDNLDCVFLSDGWKRTVENNLQLATDTVRSVSKLMTTNPN